MIYLQQFLFGIYPYIAMSIFLLGSLVRFEREQYTWKCESSQILHRGNLRIANILFHIGIIGLFLGHLIGLLTPVAVWDNLGISHSVKQLFAMLAGGIMGTCCLIGLLLLIIRRFSSERLRVHTTWADKVVLLWILVTLVLGLSTIYVSSRHLDGHEMVRLMSWAQSIVTFRGNASEFIMGADLIFKIHLVMGMSLFIIFPFSRLVHIWSGFASVSYLRRTPQLVRAKSYVNQPEK